MNFTSKVIFDLDKLGRGTFLSTSEKSTLRISLTLILCAPSLAFAVSPGEAGWNGAMKGLAQGFLVTIAVFIWYGGRAIYKRLKSHFSRKDSSSLNSSPVDHASNKYATESAVSERRPVSKASPATPSIINPPTKNISDQDVMPHQNSGISVQYSSVNSVLDENAIYASVAEEIESGNTEKGLWARLYAQCDGDDRCTKVQYIKQRAALLMDVERAKQAAEIATAKSAADREAAEIAASQRRVVEDRARSEKTAMEERVRQQLSELNARAQADEAKRVDRFKEKERDALSRLPIEKVGECYRVYGTNYYDLDDAIRYVGQLSSGNPRTNLAHREDLKTESSTVVKVFAALGLFIALVYFATQYFGSK
jgi:hypothetical protein